MTAPHDPITTSPDYARAYQHHIGLGASPEDAARNAYAATQDAIRNRTRATYRTVGIVAAVIVLAGVVVVTAMLFVPRTPTVAPSNVRAPQVVSPEPLPSPEKYTPVVTDFTVVPKITEKQCFGEAGCIVTFRIEVTYGGLPLSEEDEWLVTYSVGGGKDGPVIDSFTMRGSQVRFGSVVVQTPSTNTVLKVTVTAVAPN